MHLEVMSSNSKVGQRLTTECDFKEIHTQINSTRTTNLNSLDQLH